jgi:hypothetical protein
MKPSGFLAETQWFRRAAGAERLEVPEINGAHLSLIVA